MATEVIVPKVDMVMEAGTFVEWLKQEGQEVQKGEALFVILTDKAAIEVEAPESGILAGIKARPDEVIPVTTVIGYILQPGERLPVGEAPAAPALLQVQVPSTTASGSVRPVLTPADVRVAGAGAAAPIHPAPLPENAAAASGTKEIRATPLARSLARDLKVDLNQIPGSGPRGRIYRLDVERHVQSVQNAAPVQSDASHPRELRRMALKGPRAIIAQRLAASAATIPHIHVTVQVDMSEAVRLREKVNPIYEKESGRGVTFTAIIAHAAAHLMKNHPFLNSSLVGDEIVFWADVHLGIATDLGDTLVVPVVREAQNKKLDEISREITALVEKARTRKLQPYEMTGGTFTISNLGTAGAVSFTAIINPPEAAILAVGKIGDTPVAVNGELAIRPLLNLTLAVDHRLIDGAQAARFLADLKQVLENPYLLV